MMELKLKEDPREWQKFSILLSLFVGALLLGLSLRGHIPQAVFVTAMVAVCLFLLLIWIQPRSARGIYRIAMTGSFYVGRVVGAVLLTLLFLFVLTPLGWMLRMVGKDLLSLRKRNQASYWNKPRPDSALDRLF